MDLGPERSQSTIFDVTRSCLGLFRAYLSGNRACSDIIAQKQQQLWVWSNGLKVFARPPIGLDAQLQDDRYTNIRQMVLLLLGVLKQNLSLALELVPVSDTKDGHPVEIATQGDDDALRVPLFGMEGSLRRLEKLAAVILRATQANLTRRAFVYAENQERRDVDFESHVEAVLNFRLHDKISDGLKQLIKDTCLHRHYRILYERSRKIKGQSMINSAMETAIETPSQAAGSAIPMEEPSSSPQQQRQQHQHPTQQPEQLDTQSDHHKTNATIDSSIANEQMARDLSVEPPPKTQPSVSKTGDVMYPKAPIISQAQSDATCPICLESLPVENFEGYKWRAHIDKDIQPYVCISEDCSENLRFFENRRAWRQHMKKTHTAFWIRHLYNDIVWRCPFTHADHLMSYGSEEELSMHLLSNHTDMEETELRHIASISGAPQLRCIDTCPICGDKHLPQRRSEEPLAFDGASISSEDERLLRRRSQFDLPSGDLGNIQSSHSDQRTAPLHQPSDEEITHSMTEKYIGKHLKALAFYFSNRLMDDQEDESDSGSANSVDHSESRSESLLNFKYDEDPPKYPISSPQGPLDEHEKKTLEQNLRELSDVWDWDESYQRVQEQMLSTDELERLFPGTLHDHAATWSGIDPREVLELTTHILLLLELCERTIEVVEGGMRDALRESFGVLHDLLRHFIYVIEKSPLPAPQLSSPVGYVTKIQRLAAESKKLARQLQLLSLPTTLDTVPSVPHVTKVRELQQCLRFTLGLALINSDMEAIISEDKYHLRTWNRQTSAILSTLRSSDGDLLQAVKKQVDRMILPLETYQTESNLDHEGASMRNPLSLQASLESLAAIASTVITQQSSSSEHVEGRVSKIGKSFRQRFKRLISSRSRRPRRERHDFAASRSFLKATATASTNVVPQSSSPGNLETYFPNGNTMGLRVVYDPEDAQVDIIFIHGLMGDSYRTWADDKDDVYWPVELLGKASTNARIIAFGYDTQVLDLFSSVGQNILWGYADLMLGEIANLRPAWSKASKRKIILVVHSFGGLVAKKALCVSAQCPQKPLRQLHENVHGILFLGTPHRGSDLAPNAKRLAKLFTRLGGAAVDPGILEPLLRESPILEEVESDFRSWMKGKKDFEHITCFYEELEVPNVGLIVSKESATISGTPEPYYIHANHMEMAKFKSSDDPGFKLMHGELKRWMRAIGEDKKPVEGIEALEMKDTDRMLQSFKETLQSLNDREKAESLVIFQWICFAQEPLSLDHLRIALFLDSSRPEKTIQQCLEAGDFIAGDRLLSQFVLDRTGGLAQISPGRPKTIQLIHHSVRDFLEKDAGELSVTSGPSHLSLFQSCLKFMSFPELHSRSDEESSLPSEISSSSKVLSFWSHRRAGFGYHKAFQVFLNYATRHWHHHALAAERGSRFEESIAHGLDTLVDYNIGRSWYNRYRSYVPESIWSQNDPFDGLVHVDNAKESRPTLLHAVAAFGLLDILKLAIGKHELHIELQKAEAPTLLHWASACGQKEVAEWLISSKTVDPNKQTSRHDTPLHWLITCAEFNHGPPERIFATLQMFSENSAVDWQLKDRRGSTALHEAVSLEFSNALHTVVRKRNIGINVYDDNDWTPLDKAIHRGNEGILDMMITTMFERSQSMARGPSVERNSKFNSFYIRNHLLDARWLWGFEEWWVIELRGKDGDESATEEVHGHRTTVLHFAAQKGNMDLCQILIDSGFKAGVKDQFRREPLHRAAESGHPSIVKLLLDSGANTNSRDVYGLSPAHLAIIQGHFDIAQTLARESEKSDDRCMTKFFRAVLHGNESLAYNVCLDDANYYQKPVVYVEPTLLEQAVKSGDSKMVQALAASPNVKAFKQEKLLFWATERKHLEVIRLLVAHGATINYGYRLEKTPLHLAAEMGHQELVTLLVSRNGHSDINRKEYFQGWTPLHCAVFYGHWGIVRELAKYGADASVRDRRGRTPHEVARREPKHTESRKEEEQTHNKSQVRDESTQEVARREQKHRFHS